MSGIPLIGRNSDKIYLNSDLESNRKEFNQLICQVFADREQIRLLTEKFLEIQEQECFEDDLDGQNPVLLHKQIIQLQKRLYQGENRLFRLVKNLELTNHGSVDISSVAMIFNSVLNQSVD